MMSYTIDKTVTYGFNEAVERTIAALKNEGFGVLTDIDVQATLKAKLGVDFRPYRILGACNPPIAHKALQLEDKLGAMLPCNVIVQERPDRRVEVSAVDPLAGMERTGNVALRDIAGDVRQRLERALAAV
jgi:uncharacterized protein (DUF302 family)